jgi:glycine oxidase
MATIAVMGAGVLGLSLAWELARRGADVRVIEARHPGAGASGGLVGALAPHAPEGWTEGKARQLTSLLMADAFWTGVAAAGGVDPGFARPGRVQPLMDEPAMARAEVRAKAARDLWGGQASWAVHRAASVPGLRLACDWVAMDTLTGRISPRRALAALVAALGSRGVPVLIGTAPPAAAGVTVWANGAQGLMELGLGGAEKGQAALLSADWRHAPVVTAPGLYIVPHGDGTVAIGSTSERAFAEPDMTDHQLDALVQTARALCPDLSAAPVIERWAGLRPRAASRQPVLGALPGRPGEFVLNGGFKIGFGLAPLLAGTMADLLLEGADRIPQTWRVPRA